VLLQRNDDSAGWLQKLLLANFQETEKELFNTKREVFAHHIDVMKDPSRFAAKQDSKGTYLKRVINKNKFK
jgi:hypothetical protein